MFFSFSAEPVATLSFLFRHCRKKEKATKKLSCNNERKRYGHDEQPTAIENELGAFSQDCKSLIISTPKQKKHGLYLCYIYHRRQSVIWEKHRSKINEYEKFSPVYLALKAIRERRPHSKTHDVKT